MSKIPFKFPRGNVLKCHEIMWDFLAILDYVIGPLRCLKNIESQRNLSNFSAGT